MVTVFISFTFNWIGAGNDVEVTIRLRLKRLFLANKLFIVKRLSVQDPPLMYIDYQVFIPYYPNIVDGRKRLWSLLYD